MAKYKKKPIIIEAEQWFADKDIKGVCLKPDTGIPHFIGSPHQPHIHTLEGVHQIGEGDWVITGVQGEKYPIKDDIFRETYELAGKDKVMARKIKSKYFAKIIEITAPIRFFWHNQGFDGIEIGPLTCEGDKPLTQYQSGLITDCLEAVLDGITEGGNESTSPSA